METIINIRVNKDGTFHRGDLDRLTRTPGRIVNIEHLKEPKRRDRITKATLPEDERSCIYTAKELLSHRSDIQIVWVEYVHDDEDDLSPGHAYAFSPRQKNNSLPLNLPHDYNHETGLRVGDLRRLLTTDDPHVSDITQEVRDTPWDMT